MTDKLNRYTAPNNIWSGATDPVLAALTSSTDVAQRKGRLQQPIPVRDRHGRSWPSASAAFAAFKTGALDKDVAILAKILRARFEQHPWLADSVAERGGIDYLRSCSHLVGAYQSDWEGVGLDSPFIQALVAGYENYLAGRSEMVSEIC